MGKINFTVTSATGGTLILYVPWSPGLEPPEVRQYTHPAGGRTAVSFDDEGRAGDWVCLVTAVGGTAVQASALSAQAVDRALVLSAQALGAQPGGGGGAGSPGPAGPPGRDGVSALVVGASGVIPPGTPAGTIVVRTKG